MHGPGAINAGRQAGERAVIADENRPAPASAGEHAERRAVDVVAVGDEGGGQGIERALLEDRVRMLGKGDAMPLPR